MSSPAVPSPALAYASAGEGRPILAVHGNFASKRWFRPLLEKPPSGYRVVAPDLPGFAESRDLGGDTRIEAYADALETFIHDLHLENPVLLGHSLGGAVVLELASRAPERYRGLVLLSSPSLTGYPHTPAHDAAREMMRTNRPLLESAFVVQAPGLDAAGREAMGFSDLLDDAQAMHESGFNGNARALGQWNALERAGGLAGLPILILGGELDPLVPTAMTSELAAQLPHARLELVPEAGHWLQFERPDAFNRALSGFLQGLA